MSVSELSAILTKISSVNPALGVITMVPNSLGPSELLLKYGADPTMYLYTNVVSGMPMGNGIYDVTPYEHTTRYDESDLLDYYIHIRNLQRRIRNKRTLKRRQKMKSQQL